VSDRINAIELKQKISDLLPVINGCVSMMFITPHHYGWRATTTTPSGENPMFIVPTILLKPFACCLLLGFVRDRKMVLACP